jgi:predicted ester cyclase
VVIEFPSLEQANQRYESEDYKDLRAMRSGAAKLNAVFLEGLQEPLTTTSSCALSVLAAMRTHGMSIEANKATVLRYFLESHNAPYDLDVMDQTCSPAYAEDHKSWQRMERAAFPDKHFTIENVLAEGDQVLLRWTVRGTHLGEFWTPAGTVLPTGKRITLTSMALYRLADGIIVEEWNVHDWLAGLLQLGAEVRLPGEVKES